jgi:hypothetical protein
MYRTSRRRFEQREAADALLLGRVEYSPRRSVSSCVTFTRRFSQPPSSSVCACSTMVIAESTPKNVAENRSTPIR